MKNQDLLNTIYTGATSICTIKLFALTSAELYSLFVQSLVATAAIAKMTYELLMLLEKERKARREENKSQGLPKLPDEQKERPGDTPGL